MIIEDRLLALSRLAHGSLSKPVSCVVTHSQDVVPDSVFVALKGSRTDGHIHLKAVIDKGASVLVVEDKKYLSDLSFSGMVCEVPRTREILPVLLNDFYDFPSHKMFCAGITGTNGKSTVSYMLSFMLAHCGWKTGLIGTLQNQIVSADSTQTPVFNQKVLSKKQALTTPDSVELYGLLNHFCQTGVPAVVMEVSSIGLEQNRVGGIDFNLVVFTNLSEDHLDYHKDMSAYFQAKKSLFENMGAGSKNHCLAVINLDDPYGIKLARDISLPYISYGQKEARCTWKIISQSLSQVVFRLSLDNCDREVCLAMPGAYNVSNAVAALCCVYSAGFSLDQAVPALSYFPGVRGRLQRVQPRNNKPASHKEDLYPMVFVDYAHTPSALESVLSFLRQNKPKDSQLFCVFGCGGNRDQQKRPKMGIIAHRLADHVILTSDNPRGEDPQNIIQDCRKGIPSFKKWEIELDRKQAIKQALYLAQPQDVVLIAGKGHETQQIVGDQKIPFDDVEMVQEIWSDMAQ